MLWITWIQSYCIQSYFRPLKNKSERAKIKHGWLSPCIQKIDLITLTRYHISPKKQYPVSLWQFFKLNFWTKKLILCLFINKNPLTIILIKKLTLHFLYKDTTELSYIDFYDFLMMSFWYFQSWNVGVMQLIILTMENNIYGLVNLWSRRVHVTLLEEWLQLNHLQLRTKRFLVKHTFITCIITKIFNQKYLTIKIPL